MKTKVIAMYLPQYHRIPENDLWWGEGYTDWIAVKNAKPVYEGQQQPRIPLNDNYYDLSDKDTVKGQAELANRYGIYGFGIYHYWFNSKQVLLDKPVHIIKDNQDINTRYFFMWDNGSWKRTWSNVKFSNSWAPLYEKKNDGPEILAELVYGGEKEWKDHFDYLLPFFKDDRYIKIDGKPLFGIFNQNNNSVVLKNMFEFWNKCAFEKGLPGVLILGKSNASKEHIADYIFDYEPATHGWVGKNNVEKALMRIKDILRLKFGILKKYDYKRIWAKILKDVDKTENYLPGAFVRFDDTPRRGEKSSIVTGDTPELFETNMRKLLKKAQEYNKEFVFLTAWNEWGEGAYLEPDKQSGYRYLEAMKKAIEEIR